MSMTIESPVRVLNPHAPLVQAAQLERPEVHVPNPVVDFLQPDILADADDRHVHPATIPPDPPVGADVPDLEAVRVLERRKPVWHRPRRGRVTRGWRLLVERLVRALVIELLAKDVELALLRRKTPGRRPGRLCLQRAMHSFMAPVLRRPARLDQLGENAQAHPPRRQ